jgi:hypothetical protein
VQHLSLDAAPEVCLLAVVGAEGGEVGGSNENISHNYGENNQTLVHCMRLFIGLFGALYRALLTYMVLGWQAAHERTVWSRCWCSSELHNILVQ